MPSRNNPNVPTSQKRKSSRSKVQKRNAAATSSSSSSSLKAHKKNPRGTAPSSVLHPTGGPAAPLSGKKARKVERAIMRERRRREELAMKMAGEVVMTDAPRTTKPKTSKAGGEEASEAGMEGMDVDVSVS